MLEHHSAITKNDFCIACRNPRLRSLRADAHFSSKVDAVDRWTTLAFGALVPAAVFAQVAPETAPKFAAHVLTRAEFDALRASPDKLLIVDVRRPDEIGTIGGFDVYLNIQTANIDKRLNA